MYFWAALVLAVTGIIVISDIFFGFRHTLAEFYWIVKIARVLFWLSLLFFVSKLPVKKKENHINK